MNAISVDDLIALNDEIAALVRAGVPLEQGLSDLGEDLPGRMGQFATELSQRTARGESLAQALADDTARLPAGYRAVVEAGVKAGRLPAALEAVATATRRQVETQRAAMVAVLYPLLVVLVAWCGMLFFILKIGPSFEKVFKDFGIPLPTLTLSLLKVLYFICNYGLLYLPVVLLPAAIAWWLACNRLCTIPERWSGRLLGWVPWMGPMLRYSRTAAFLEVLTLLVENQTPLDEAVELAAEASGDRSTAQSARQLADALRSGQTLPAGDGARLSPLLCWLLMAAGRDGALLPALRHAATAYHRRARHQADMARVFLPVLLTVVIGGSVTASYAFAVFVPYVDILHALGR
jgi:type II secretory pathway component PulF